MSSKQCHCISEKYTYIEGTPLLHLCRYHKGPGWGRLIVLPNANVRSYRRSFTVLAEITIMQSAVCSRVCSEAVFRQACSAAKASQVQKEGRIQAVWQPSGASLYTSYNCLRQVLNGYVSMLPRHICR
jgi:hypothetical protein